MVIRALILLAILSAAAGAAELTPEQREWLQRYTARSDDDLIADAAAALDCSGRGGIRQGLRFEISTPDDGLVSGPPAKVAVPIGPVCANP